MVEMVGLFDTKVLGCFLFAVEKRERKLLDWDLFGLYKSHIIVYILWLENIFKSSLLGMLVKNKTWKLTIVEELCSVLNFKWSYLRSLQILR